MVLGLTTAGLATAARNTNRPMRPKPLMPMRHTIFDRMEPNEAKNKKYKQTPLCGRLRNACCARARGSPAANHPRKMAPHHRRRRMGEVRHACVGATAAAGVTAAALAARKK